MSWCRLLQSPVLSFNRCLALATLPPVMDIPHGFWADSWLGMLCRTVLGWCTCPSVPGRATSVTSKANPMSAMPWLIEPKQAWQAQGACLPHLMVTANTTSISALACEVNVRHLGHEHLPAQHLIEMHHSCSAGPPTVAEHLPGRCGWGCAAES